MERSISILRPSMEFELLKSGYLFDDPKSSEEFRRLSDGFRSFWR